MSSPGYSTGGTSINVASTTNWPTDTGVTFAIDETDADGLRVSGTYNVFRGTVNGATQITNVTYVGGDANRNYSAGASTRVYILVSKFQMNRLIDGLLLNVFNQDGTMADGAVPTAALTDSGWIAFSLQNSWTAGGAETPYYRKIGNVVYLKGSVTKSGVTAFETVATLPSGYRPTEVVRPGITLNSTTAAACQILVSGAIQMWSSASTSAYRGLYCSFTVD